MKLLLDANISWRLVHKLKPLLEDCLHVDNCELVSPAKDIDIWNFCLNNNFVIVTNDEDFVDLSNNKGFPPKIVLMKTGNQRNSFLEEVLIKHLQSIEAFCMESDFGVFEIY